MAEESVYIDLDEVQSSAKAIMGLLKELEGPANQLEAAVKQVQDSVYGADVLGKSLQGSGSSVGGLGQHQEQVLAGIRVLMQNATAMGDNLLTMAARHEANDQLHAAELTRIGGTATTPAAPGQLFAGEVHLASAPVATGQLFAGEVHPASAPVATGQLFAGEVHPASAPVATGQLSAQELHLRAVEGQAGRQFENTTASPVFQPTHFAPLAEPTPDMPVRVGPRLSPLLPLGERGIPVAPIGPVSVPDAGVDYHDPDAPELHYNDHPNPLFQYYAAD